MARYRMNFGLKLVHVTVSKRVESRYRFRHVRIVAEGQEPGLPAAITRVGSYRDEESRCQ